MYMYRASFFLATFLNLSLWLECTSFQTSIPAIHVKKSSTSSIHAKAQKKKKAPASRGGGFGGSQGKEKTSSVPTISADKNSLEKQWDIFAGITDLEITPKGNPDDEDYVHFEVADVFVRCGETKSNSEGTKWFRIGKVCITDDTSIEAALTLQKGLIFWTAVHMRRELVAAGGKSGAAALQLGYTAATLNMGSESDGPLDEDEEEAITLSSTSSSLQGVKSKTFGFRPDWNPPGFTYKRREKAAMKKKTSKLDEMKSAE